MKTIIDFLKSEGLLCLLLTFFICAWIGLWAGVCVTVIMILCNIFYTKKLNLYNIIGFACGWGFSLLNHIFY